MRRAIVGLYRFRGLLLVGAVVATLATMPLRALLPALDDLLTIVLRVGVGGLLLAGLLALFGARLLPQHRVVSVTPPVRGRWLAMNSPSTKVPSHGVRAYGQAYAIDLVFDPVDGSRPEFASGPVFRAVEEYPALGEPVHAMVDGVVVAASDGQRDHRARSHYPALLYLAFEGAIRELGGPRFVIGNHVIIRSDDGVFALVAHLQRGSLLVRRGDHVAAGQMIASCGNTGNSTEPHVHAQLMDRSSPLTGQGIPMEFDGVRLPADGEHLG